METKLRGLRMRLLEVNRLSGWDQANYMPGDEAEARGCQMSTLSCIAHEKFTDPAVGKLLDDLRACEESLPYDSDEASLIRVTRREYDGETRVPASFVAELDEHSAALYQTWTEARPANDFASMR